MEVGRRPPHRADLTRLDFFSPSECNEDDGTCDQLAEEYTWAHSLMTFEEALQHKYVIDVDGNTWSSRFQRLLLGGSLVFKSTIMPEWWNDRAQPWVHYVPVQLDYSDVLDALVFVSTAKSTRLL